MTGKRESNESGERKRQVAKEWRTLYEVEKEEEENEVTYRGEGEIES